MEIFGVLDNPAFAYHYSKEQTSDHRISQRAHLLRDDVQPANDQTIIVKIYGPSPERLPVKRVDLPTSARRLLPGGVCE